MAIKRRLEKKSDEALLDLTEARVKATSFFEKNQKIILGVLIGLVVIVGGWFAYNNLVKEPKEQKAMSQMWKAQMQFEQDSFVVALENPGAGYLGFIQIAKDYSGTKAGNLANFYAGVSYLNLGNFDEALKYVNAYHATGTIGPNMKHGVLGDIYSELNQMDKAVENYHKAAATENDLLTPYYLKKEALLLESQNKMADALEIYKKIKSKYPNSNEALSIEKYIARAEAVK